MPRARKLDPDMAKRARGPGKPTLEGPMKENVRAAVKVALERVHNNQSALGKVLHTSQGVVSDWNSGKSTPSLSSVEELAHFLGRRVAEVLEGASYPLETALAYWPGRWPDHVVAEARKLAEKGEKADAQGWTRRMDELRDRTSRR